MKLITDDKIPFVTDFFSNFTDIEAIPGDKISNTHLQEAQILLTRTITPITQALLQNTDIQFIGSATTGTDHIDQGYVKSQSLTLATSAGANASAVAEYVLCCIASLMQHGYLMKKPIIGIIGCGRIGTLLAKLLLPAGFKVIGHDPLLSQHPLITLCDLDTLLRQSNLITLHTPLTRTGQYPTYHLIDSPELKKIKPRSVLINTSRGNVVNEKAILQNTHITYCLDVWENEPLIAPNLLEQVFIGTPHIAGYTVEAKRRATEMLFEQAAKYFNWPMTDIQTQENSAQKALTHHWASLALSYFDPLTETQALKNKIAKEENMTADIFKQQRQKPFRQSFLADHPQ